MVPAAGSLVDGFVGDDGCIGGVGRTPGFWKTVPVHDGRVAGSIVDLVESGSASGVGDKPEHAVPGGGMRLDTWRILPINHSRAGFDAGHPLPARAVEWCGLACWKHRRFGA